VTISIRGTGAATLGISSVLDAVDAAARVSPRPDAVDAAARE